MKEDEYELVNDLVNMIVEGINKIEGYEEEKEYVLKNLCYLVECLMNMLINR